MMNIMGRAATENFFRGGSLFSPLQCQGRLFLNLAGSVRDDHVIDFGLMAVTFVELLGHSLDERIMERIGNEVDGTATETAAHDT